MWDHRHCQETVLFDELSVSENISSASICIRTAENARLAGVHRRANDPHPAGSRIDHEPLKTLSIAQRHMVAIAGRWLSTPRW